MKANIERINELTALVKKLWIEDDEEDLKEMLIHSIENKNEEVFVVEEDHQYIKIAMCSLRFDYVERCNSTPVGYLEGIYVDKQYRNKGIAGSLLKEGEIWSKEKDTKNLLVIVKWIILILSLFICIVALKK